jgi:hypothetical protein
MDASKDQKNKINILEAMHYTESAWQQVTQHTVKYCFRKAGCGRGQPSDVSDVAMRNEADDDAFHDQQKFSGMDNETFDDDMSVDSYLATSSPNTAKELCESHVGTMSVEGEEEEGEDSEPKPEVVPNFAQAQEVLVKVKSFVYAHSNSSGDCDSVLSLESSFCKLRCKVSTKQLSIRVFFTRISSFNGALCQCNCQ